MDRDTTKVGPLLVTKKALSQFILSSIEDEHARKMVRVGCKGGGCSGFLYVLEFTEDSEIDPEDDEIFEESGLRFVIDAFSKSYLENTTIDFVSTIKESGFKFTSPSVKRTCGCGQSFS